MKKMLLVSILLLGVILITATKIGAQMNETTEVRASHILVLSQKEDSDINEITFEEAAKEYSQCPSKAQGGDLGFFGHGVMVKEFEDAAFSAPLNSVSDPVKTQFGWHLIKVTDRK